MGGRYSDSVTDRADAEPSGTAATGRPQPTDADQVNPFVRLTGGVRGALETVVPPLVFVWVYLGLGANGGRALGWALAAALFLALVFTIWRLLERKHPARAVGSMLLVVVSAYIASRTGNAADFFWPRVLLNAGSGLAFVVANVARWPLIGVILGPLFGTRMRWRQDPDLMRAYTRGSWPFAALNFVRAAILALLIDGDHLWALAASGAAFYALTALTVAASWWLLRGALPADHPGLRHPRARPR